MKLLGSIWTLPVLVGLLTMVLFAGGEDELKHAITEFFSWFMGGFLGTIIVLTYVRVSRLPLR